MKKDKRMIPYGYVGEVCTRIGCPGDVGEETGYVEQLLAGRHADRYKVVAGRLVAKSAEEIAVDEAQKLLLAQKDEIAAQRFSRETANMRHDGHEWFMDREARTTLYLTIAEVLSGELPQEYFKTATGWYLITPENAAAIKQAGRDHVRAAFAWEKSEVDKLQS